MIASHIDNAMGIKRQYKISQLTNLLMVIPHLVRHAPGKNAGMVIVSLNHFLERLQSCLMQFWREVAFGLLPPGEFFLGQNTHLIHIVEHTIRLNPVESSDGGIQMLHHLHRLVYIAVGFCHTVGRIAALHGFDARKTYLLAIQYKPFAHQLELTDTEMVTQNIAVGNGERGKAGTT